MKLIFGLGNPGTKYNQTRHNIGFMFLDYLVKDLLLDGNWEINKKLSSEIFDTNINGEKVLLIKPQTFMNLSGEAVLKVMSYYKIKKKDIIIIYDDISMEFGKIRYREKGSAGGQNGIKNIISKIGDDFPRIKIGIGLNDKYDVSSWVLSKLTSIELNELDNKIFYETKKLIFDNKN